MVALSKSTVWWSTIITLVFLLPSFSNIVVAEDNWKIDGWLNNQWTEMRLDNGDEFGCHGMPGMDLDSQTLEVAIACKDYLGSMTNASRWGSNPLSFGVDTDLTYSKHKILNDEGFRIHGVETGLVNTSWHSSFDIPQSNDDWWNLGQLGSIESGASKLSDVQNLAVNGGMINLYWEARIADLKLRTNRELLDWLESDNNSWMTTWGEAWSYWSHRSDGFDAYQSSNVSWGVEFNSTVESGVWDIPITRGFVVGDSEVTSVQISGIDHPASKSSDRKLKPGWRQEGELFYLTIFSGDQVTINFDSVTLAVNSSPCAAINEGSFEDCNSIEKPAWYNNLSWALTITGHHTSNLFDWSNKFDESELVFTWLVIPEPLEEYTIILPTIGVFVAVATIWYARKIIRDDKQIMEEKYSEE